MTARDLARDVAGSRPAGFVNAVLRRGATRDLAAWLEIAAPSRSDDLIRHLYHGFHGSHIVNAHDVGTRQNRRRDGRRGGVFKLATGGLAEFGEKRFPRWTDRDRQIKRGKLREPGENF